MKIALLALASVTLIDSSESANLRAAPNPKDILESADCQAYVQDTDEHLGYNLKAFIPSEDDIAAWNNDLYWDDAIFALQTAVCEPSRRSKASEREKGYESRLPDHVADAAKCSKAGDDVIAMNFRENENLAAALIDSNACKQEVRQEIGFIKMNPGQWKSYDKRVSLLGVALGNSALDGGAAMVDQSAIA